MRHRVTAALTVLVAAVFSPLLWGQKFNIQELRLVEGQMIWNSGEVVSRDGAAVKFEMQVDADGKMIAYKLGADALQAVKPGDKIPLHFVGIKMDGSFPNFPGLKGGQGNSGSRRRLEGRYAVFGHARGHEGHRCL